MSVCGLLRFTRFGEFIKGRLEGSYVIVVVFLNVCACLCMSIPRRVIFIGFVRMQAVLVAL